MKIILSIQRYNPDVDEKPPTFRNIRWRSIPTSGCWTP
jgi:hypothetical protein